VISGVQPGCFIPKKWGGLSHLVGEIPQVLASSFGKNARAKGTWGHFGGHVLFHPKVQNSPMCKPSMVCIKFGLITLKLGGFEVTQKGIECSN